jgi:hypothetical protein
MKRVWAIAAILLVGMGAMAAAAPAVYVEVGGVGRWVDLGPLEWITGTVAYQGPVFDTSDPNWKSEATYTGVRLAELLASVGEARSDSVVSIIAGDGYAKAVPVSVLSGKTAAGEVLLALDNGDPDWEGSPMLVFLAPDGRFSDDDMIESLGAERSHYYGEDPSTTGLMVKNVTYVIVDYDGSPLPDLASMPPGSDESKAAVPDGTLTVVLGGAERTYAMSEVLEFEHLTASGTFTNSAGADYVASYTGVRFSALLGWAAAGDQVRVTAADGYSMNYEAGMLLDIIGGTWIVAYKEDGEFMPLDPGYLRIVQVGPDNPHFTSSLSARMVERIEVIGDYITYTLTASGAVTRIFERAELEAGIGCPCHTSTITVTSKGETATYAGLPLWRLIAYIDDDAFPTADQGIHYEESDFNDGWAETYTIVLTASDGYSQSVPGTLIARDDRFIVALKKDGAFLDPSKDGFMRFVYDDSVVLPGGVDLKSVKFLSTITIEG